MAAHHGISVWHAQQQHGKHQAISGSSSS